MKAGILPPVGVRWFRISGGMPSTHLVPAALPVSGHSLMIAEREEIALERVRGAGIRTIVRKLDRSPSTISREIRRNAATRGGKREYRATTAQWHADRAARCPRPGKLATNAARRAYVEARLAGEVRNAAGIGFDGPDMVCTRRRTVYRQKFDAGRRLGGLSRSHTLFG